MSSGRARARCCGEHGGLGGLGGYPCRPVVPRLLRRGLSVRKRDYACNTLHPVPISSPTHVVTASSAVFSASCTAFPNIPATPTHPHAGKALPPQAHAHIRSLLRPTASRVTPPPRSGKGMPVTKEPGAFGNMVLKFDVKFPRELSDATKQQLRAILPSH